jgi:cellulose synthase/poly-beta-1,6-N-acetylglucosamine synthase-like glycosyltransferase
MAELYRPDDVQHINLCNIQKRNQPTTFSLPALFLTVTSGLCTFVARLIITTAFSPMLRNASMPEIVSGPRTLPIGITVIVPVYNGACYLERSLESIRMSCYSNFSCIVVDDDSTDDSVRIAERLGVDVVSLAGGPFGPAYARNRGAAAAQGSILFFVDADLRFARDLSSRLPKFFDSNPTSMRSSDPMTLNPQRRNSSPNTATFCITLFIRTAARKPRLTERRLVNNCSCSSTKMSPNCCKNFADGGYPKTRNPLASREQVIAALASWLGRSVGFTGATR